MLLVMSFFRYVSAEVPAFLCTFDASDCEAHLILDSTDGLLRHEKVVVARANSAVNDYTGLQTGKFLLL